MNKKKLTFVILGDNNTIDTESVISILKSTFKNRPDDSQGGLIEEKIQKMQMCKCPKVDQTVVKAYLRDNKNSYVVDYCYYRCCL